MTTTYPVEALERSERDDRPSADEMDALILADEALIRCGCGVPLTDSQLSRADYRCGECRSQEPVEYRTDIDPDEAASRDALKLLALATRGMHPEEKARYIREHSDIEVQWDEDGNPWLPQLSTPDERHVLHTRFEGMKPVFYCTGCPARKPCWGVWFYLRELAGMPGYSSPCPWLS